MPIVAVRAQLVDGADVLRSSSVHVTEASTYHGGAPRQNGPMDTAMGVIDRAITCRTCGQFAPACPGHHGHVELVRPVMHPSHFAVRRVLSVLTCVCWDCSRLLRTDANAQAMARAQRMKCARGVRFAAAREACRLVRKCEACAHVQPRVMRVGQGSWSFSIETAAGREPASVERIYTTLDRITDDDSLAMGFDPHFTHPRRLMFTALPVLPPHVRPAVSLNPSVVNQDDLTSTLSVIVKRNALLRKQMQDGTASLVWRASEQMLAYGVHCWIDGTDVPVPVTGFVRGCSSGKSIKSIRRRIEGKQGLVRQNLLGKRTDFTARTVITGDPAVSIREVGVPLSIANNLTFPERVTPRNVGELTRLVAVGHNGTLHRRGARFIVRKCGLRQSLSVNPAFEPLEEGDTVERQLRDGDVVIFNRQPSLHRMSLMAHRVRVMHHSTFRLNLSCTTPYNADFDGDEMNMHVPQTHEARAEALLLMTPPTQIVSPQNNRPVMSIVQDTLLGAAVMTQRDSFLDKAEMWQLAMEAGLTELPIPAVLKPERLWTGKQLFSMLLPDVSLDTVASTHADGDSGNSDDTRVRIRRGELTHGYTCKRTLGNVEQGLVHTIASDFGCERAADFIDALQRVAAAWLSYRPLTVSIGDFIVDEATQRAIALELGACERSVRGLGAALGKRTIDVRPGLTAEATVEAACCTELNKARDAIGKIVTSAVERSNNMRLMTTVACSKGSLLNIAQTIGCVGQQSVDGQRPEKPNGRCLPCFSRAGYWVDDPMSRGFVSSSYIKGLTPAEVFFHAMGAREGLIDTAVKTSETGYTQRRLVKVAEAMRIGYNGAVVDANGTVVQWLYGDDGMDGACVETHAPYMLSLGRDEFARRCCAAESVPRMLAAYDAIRDGWRSTKRAYGFANIARLAARAAALPKRGAPLGGAGVVEAARRLLSELMPLAAAIIEGELFARCARLDAEQAAWLLVQLETRKRRAAVHAGEMVGSIAAQSIGEPATQMTLNTFHSAGCASQLLQGVPRLKELLNATPNIRTPTLRIFVHGADGGVDGQEAAARAVQASLVFRTVHCVAAETEICYEPDPRAAARGSDQALVDAYWDVPDEEIAATFERGSFSPWVVRVVLDGARLVDARLAVSEVARRVSAAVGAAFVHASDDNDDVSVLRVRAMQVLAYADAVATMQAVMAVHVGGVAGILGAVVTKTSELGWGPCGRPLPTSQWVVDTIGASFVDVARVPLVDQTRLYCNDVLLMNQVLGIEVARAVLVSELRAVIEDNGSYVNHRHISLLCDVMTYRGDVASFTRHGLGRSDAGFLARCSFEETIEVLHTAATFGDRECIRDKGVTANIIFGQMAPVGTGCCHLLLDTDMLEQSLPRSEGRAAILPRVEETATPRAKATWNSLEVEREDYGAYVPTTP
jgi:DNA-directed RNA polymerase II subunit RPB1